MSKDMLGDCIICGSCRKVMGSMVTGINGRECALIRSDAPALVPAAVDDLKFVRV